MEDLFSLDINSVEIVNESEDKLSRTSRLNGYIERFSILIKHYLKDPSVYDDLLFIFKAIKIHGNYLKDTYTRTFAIKLNNGWYKVKKNDLVNITYYIIGVDDRIELDNLISAYSKKCKADSTDGSFTIREHIVL
jgi:hypothetical protein|nr:MAG TPA: hypothetical protein [Caudoviricetes sp.]